MILSETCNNLLINTIRNSKFCKIMVYIASVTFVFSLGVFIALLVSRTNGLELNTSIKKLVIDTDAGGDDAMAILSLLAVQEAYPNAFEIVAITCSYGNTFLGNVEDNVKKVLTTAKRHDIKVYSGTAKPLIDNFTNTAYYGQDGFGDFDFEQTITAEIDYSLHASIALVQLAKKYKGSLTILTLGPLTNVALACTLDPNFTNNVNTFYVAGSSVRGLGNVSPGKEFNFFMDPISNFILFSSVKKPGAIILFPWETAVDSQISMKWRKEVLGSYDSPYIHLLNKAEEYAFEHDVSTIYTPCDPIAAVTMLWPQIVTNEKLLNVQAIKTGEGKGSLLVDYANKTSKLLNTRIVEGIRVDIFKELLIKYLT